MAERWEGDGKDPVWITGIFRQLRTCLRLDLGRDGPLNEPATAGARCARGRSQWHRWSDQASGIG
jgi:hypothetical protein